MEEIWKDINGYECLYQVSNLGRVKSLEYKGKKREKILQLNDNGKGYLRASLWKGKKGQLISVHRLVATTFILNEENKGEINHKDGNKYNNHIDNLEFCTRLENMKHCFLNNLRITSDLQKKHLSDRESIPIIDINNGMIYKSIKEACKDCSISYPYLAQMLRGLYPNKTSFRYLNKYKDGIQEI